MIISRGRRWGTALGTLAGLVLVAGLAPVRQAAAGVLADVPVQPSREQARGWALRELSGREYADARPGVVERALLWLFDRLGQLGGSEHPVSLLLLGVILAVLLALIGWAVYRAGGLRRTARVPGSAVLDRPDTTAAEHRQAAERHAEAGRWGPAVLERFRAVARTLEEQAVLTPQPGRTADELARDGGLWLPDLAADLAAGARLFDDVCYGDRSVGEDAYVRLRLLDERVGAARPVSHAGSGSGALTVPS